MLHSYSSRDELSARTWALSLHGQHIHWPALVVRPPAAATFAAVLWASRGLPLLVSALLASAAFAAATVVLRV